MTEDAQGISAARMPGAAEIAETLALPPMQRMAAEHLLKSQTVNAPVTILGEADAEALMALRDRARGEGTEGVSLTAVLIAIVAATLGRHPRLNAARVGKTLEIYADINIGVALALADGNLIVPVLKHADTLERHAVIAALADFRARGEAGKLTLDDVRGGTFTVSNAGMVPAARWTTPIIPLGQTAILGIGGVRRAPVVRDDRVVPGWLLPLSLTFDHAAINGLPAAAFLDDLAEGIADPAASAASLDI